MASISTYKSKDKTTTYRAIQFVGADRKRRSIRLGSMPAKDVEDIRQRITLLEVYRKGGRSPDADSAAWLGRVGDDVYDKLAAGGLVERRLFDQNGQIAEGPTLGQFLADYLEKRQAFVKAGKLSPDTVRNERATREALVSKFGADKLLSSFNAGDAVDFRHFLLTQGSAPAKRCGSEVVILSRRPLGESTTRKRCSTACKFFKAAVRSELISRNPFDTDAVPKSNLPTADHYYIKAADAWAVMAKLPDTQWKLVFALCRWGGLRIGETRLLTWADVLWDESKLLVHCEKTEHIIGHETRLVPMFPELVDLLDQRYEEAATGDVYVLTMLQGKTNASLRKRTLRAIQVAGVKPWPRLFHNLCGTRQNELLEAGHKEKAVCAWLGNSAAVASRHYAKVTEEDFRKAIAPLSAPPGKQVPETAGKA